MKYLVEFSYFCDFSSKTKHAEIRTDAASYGELRQIIDQTAERYGWNTNEFATMVTVLATGERYTLQFMREYHESSHKADVRALKIAGWVGVACVTVLAFAVIFACKGYLPLKLHDTATAHSVPAQAAR